MPDTPIIVKATFRIRGSRDDFPVHFNPETLQYTISNNLRNTGSGNSTKQYVSDSTGKLTMDLIFDTTDSGEDVRLHTVRMARLMEPGESDKTPPVVEFEWGLYTFAGMVESYKETIDFFSADGVPLRAAVNVTLSSQDLVFEGGSKERRATTGTSLARSGDSDSVQAPIPGSGDGRGVTQTATRAGNPAAAHDIAAQNGIENMRFPGRSQLQINGATSAAAAASLAVSGASMGGSFAALRTRPAAAVGGKLRPGNFLRPAGTAGLGTEDASAFALGGQTRLQGSASFKADVGKAGALQARIEFDGGE